MITWKEQLLTEGSQKGRRSLLISQLEAKFGSIPDAVRARIDAAQAADLDRWAVQLLSAESLEDALR